LLPEAALELGNVPNELAFAIDVSRISFVPIVLLDAVSLLQPLPEKLPKLGFLNPEVSPNVEIETDRKSDAAQIIP
jgi:hypothetical protein